MYVYILAIQPGAKERRIVNSLIYILHSSQSPWYIHMYLQ